MSLRSGGKANGHLGEEQPLWHQAEGELVTGIVQEVFQPQEGHATQLPPVAPMHPNLQLSGLHREARMRVRTWHQPSPGQHSTPRPKATPAHTKASLTRSRGTTKVWSQDCLATGPQPVWPTTRLSTFSTASTSPAGPELGLRAGWEWGSFAVLPKPHSLCLLLTGQLASTTLLLGPAPKPALGGAPSQHGYWGTSRHGCQQLFTAQEVDLQRPWGECEGECHQGPPSHCHHQWTPGTPGMLPSRGDG